MCSFVKTSIHIILPSPRSEIAKLLGITFLGLLDHMKQYGKESVPFLPLAEMYKSCICSCHSLDGVLLLLVIKIIR